MFFATIVTITILIFLLFPSLDIWVSSHFFDGDKFYNKTEGFLGFVYNVTPLITIAILAMALIGTGFLLITKKPLGIWHKKHIIFLVVSLALGPGLIINGILKTHWDRARPAHIETFGGSLTFTSPLVPSDQCKKNCSFASGHAAVGFFLMVFAFLYPRHRNAWLAMGTAIGSLIGLARIAQGGHFLSDVIFSGLITYACIWISYYTTVKRRPV